MSNTTTRFAALTATALAIAMPVLSHAGTIFLARDTVVPVVIENNLTLRGAREGDRFTAHVEGNADLPFHTRFVGQVRRISRERRNDQVAVELEFTDVILPDGSRHPIRATPVSLDSRYVDRRDDGRVIVRNDDRRKEGYVLGGTVGGFILGSIIHKQAESTVLGTLAGVIAAESDRQNNGDLILHRHDHVGALIERDTTLETYGRLGGRMDGRRGDRWDRNDDYGRPRDRRGSDDWDRRGDDRNGDDRSNNRGDDRDNNRRDDRRDDRGIDRRDDAAVRDIVVNYDDRELRFDDKARPYREGETIMVPLEFTAKEMGVDVENGRSKAIYLECDDSSLRLEQGSNEARLNGRRVTLAAPIAEKDGVLYAPVDILASIAKGKILVNGNRVNPRAF